MIPLQSFCVGAFARRLLIVCDDSNLDLALFGCNECVRYIVVRQREHAAIDGRLGRIEHRQKSLIPRYSSTFLFIVIDKNTCIETVLGREEIRFDKVTLFEH